MNKFNLHHNLPVLVSLMAIIVTLPLAVVLVVSQTTNTRSKAAAASNIYFSPPTLNVTSGQPFALDAMLNPGSNLVTAIEMHVTFNPNYFTLNSVSADPSVPNILPAFANQNPAAPVIDNTNGTLTLIVGAPQTQPLNTTKKIATFNFTPKNSAATSAITFANTTVASALQESGNVILSRQPSAISVITPTPTPTPSPTSTPTPTPTQTPTPTPSPSPTPTPTSTPTPTPIPRPGDLDLDGDVDIFDYNNLVQYFGRTGTPGFLPADIDRDGDIDIFDYNVLVQNFDTAGDN